MFFLAWRQLLARKKQTLLILLGISFGTLLYVSISGVQLGMRQYISDQLLNSTAHILIRGADRTIKETELTDKMYGDGPKVLWRVPPSGKRGEARLENYSGWYERLKSDPEVLDFSPRLSSNAILTNGKFTASVNLTGTIPSRHAHITSVERYMKQGRFVALEGGPNNIVIGSGVAEQLGVRLNQYVRVDGGRGEGRPFKIVGVVHFGNQQLDDSVAFANLNSVQTLIHSPGRVSSIAVALYDIDKATSLADDWQVVSADRVEDWQEANRMFMEMIRVQDFVRYFITVAVLIVAAFGIYNVLSIMISQKRKEIAILRAIGYGPERILQLILYQGLLLGGGGGLIGIILGFLLCLWIESVDFGFEIGGSNHLLVLYSPSIYITAALAAWVAAIVASYLPAHDASRMTPMEIIRAD
ncbi:MAG: ABC transporter permease [Bdellovibrionales bacterium]